MILDFGYAFRSLPRTYRWTANAYLTCAKLYIQDVNTFWAYVTAKTGSAVAYLMKVCHS